MSAAAAGTAFGGGGGVLCAHAHAHARASRPGPEDASALCVLRAGKPPAPGAAEQSSGGALRGAVLRGGCQPHLRSPAAAAGAPAPVPWAVAGQDHQEDHPEDDLQRVQGCAAEAHQAGQALRDLRQEAQDQGPDVLERLYNTTVSQQHVTRFSRPTIHLGCSVVEQSGLTSSAPPPEQILVWRKARAAARKKAPCPSS